MHNDRRNGICYSPFSQMTSKAQKLNIVIIIVQVVVMKFEGFFCVVDFFSVKAFVEFHE